MPGRDGTGPLGDGPMTGGGWGPCGGTAVQTGGRPRFGRALAGTGGDSFGRGRGRRNRFYATGAPGLQDEVETLRSTLTEVRQRLEQLENK